MYGFNSRHTGSMADTDIGFFSTLSLIKVEHVQVAEMVDVMLGSSHFQLLAREQYRFESCPGYKDQIKIWLKGKVSPEMVRFHHLYSVDV
jgi:hypothetical protein